MIVHKFCVICTTLYSFNIRLGRSIYYQACDYGRRRVKATKEKVMMKKLRNLDLIQLHLKLQKNLESKKVTKKGEYYFAKGFKVLLSCAKKIVPGYRTVITIKYLGNHKCFPFLCKIYFSNIMCLVPTIKTFITLKILQKYVMLID